ncbi:MAG: choice-of-anchor D domain-containing protein [bacterium]
MKVFFIVLMGLAVGCGDTTNERTPVDETGTNQSTNNNLTNNGVGATDPDPGAPTQPAIAIEGLLDFGGVAAGSTKTMPLEITNHGTALTITDIELDGTDFEIDEIALPLVIAQDETVSLDIHLTPSEATERLGTVRITSDDPSSPEVAAQLVANELCGELNNVTTLLDNTVVGQTYTSTVTLTNCSDVVEIHVTAFEHAAAGNPEFADDFTFSDVEAPFVIAPGEAYSFDVLFEPLTPGDHAVEFTLSTTGTLGPNKSQFAGRVVARDVAAE